MCFLAVDSTVSVTKKLKETHEAVSNSTINGDSEQYYQDIAFAELDMLIGKLKGTTKYKALNTIDSLTNTEKKILERVINTPQLTEVAAASRAKLRLALTETDPDRQKQFLEEAVCGSYYEKFACMCGMLYLADRWETQGIDGLQSAFADYHGFAQRALSIRI